MRMRDGRPHDDDGGAREAGRAPGKRTLSEGWTIQRRAGTSAPAAASTGAAKSASAPQGDDPFGLHLGGAALPDPVRLKMETSFGEDFSSVRVHQDSSAASLGALAYARGTDVHFAPGQYDPGSAAGQSLIGHELAHVVQQRAGRVTGVQTKAGVAINSDPALEAEADEMGARAARGEPAPMPGGSGGSAAPVLQGYFVLDPEEMKKVVNHDSTFSGQEAGSDNDNPKSFLDDQSVTNLVQKDTVTALRVSDDGNLAIEDADLVARQAKNFFIAAGLIDGTNEKLEEQGSQYRILADGGTLEVPDHTGNMHTLTRVIAQSATNKEHKGDTLNTPVNCNEMAEDVTGAKGPALKLHTNTKEQLGYSSGSADIATRMSAYVKAYSDTEKDNATRFSWSFYRNDPEAKGKEATGFQYEKRSPPDRITRMFEVTVKTTEDVATFVDLVDTKLPRSTMVRGKDAERRLITIGFGEDRVIGRMEEEPFVALIEARKEIEPLRFPQPPQIDPGLMLEKQGQIGDSYARMDPEDKESVSKKIGINDHANPDIGGAFMINPTGVPDEEDKILDRQKDEKIDAGFPYHWGGVIAKSGADIMTMENYARKDEDGNKKKPVSETRHYFQLYGTPASINDKAETFHQFWSKYFANPLTLSFKNSKK